MVEVYTVKYSEVEPWQGYVESNSVKWSHGSVMQSLVNQIHGRSTQSLVDELKPWQIYVESSRVK